MVQAPGLRFWVSNNPKILDLDMFLADFMFFSPACKEQKGIWTFIFNMAE